MPEHVRISFRDDVETARTEFLDSRRSEIGEHEQHEKHLLGRTGKRFWQDESEDHRVRKSREYERIIHSIEENPVTAGLVASAALWLWSGAGWQAKPPATPTTELSLKI